MGMAESLFREFYVVYNDIIIYYCVLVSLTIFGEE